MPKTENPGPKREPALVAVLREAIRVAAADGVSARELARRSGVHLGGILRFTKGERDLTATSAGRLTEALGLVLVPKACKKAVGRGTKKSRASG